MSIGIIFAVAAMLCWGAGDFLIQKSARRVGGWETLFLITFFGSVVLFPIIWHEIPKIVNLDGNGSWILLIFAGLTIFIASLVEFEAFRRGKLSVVEPTLSLEIFISAIFAYFILSEALGMSQIIVILLLITGLFLVSYRGRVFSAKFLLEKGVLLGIGAALVMGMANFFVGWGAREVSPLMSNFAINIFCCVGSGAVLLARGRLAGVWKDLKDFRQTLIPMIIFDNIAWIAFAYGLTLAPIGITVALSESYIIIAVLLGIFINKEKLERHQMVGLILALASAVALAAMTL